MKSSHMYNATPPSFLRGSRTVPVFPVNLPHLPGEPGMPYQPRHVSDGEKRGQAVQMRPGYGAEAMRGAALYTAPATACSIPTQPAILQVPQVLQVSETFTPRPHPHLTAPILSLSNVPADLPEVAIVDALCDCGPLGIELSPPIFPQHRLRPDVYYEWMPRTGTLQFSSLHYALAILIAHPYLAALGLIVSPSAPSKNPYDFPALMPFPHPSVPARYIRPTILVHPQEPSLEPTTAIAQLFPSLGELFELLRPWGAMRQIGVWFEGDQPPQLTWGARVEFWHDDEAQRFQFGFGMQGSHVKGWQISIFTEVPQQIPEANTTSVMPLAATVPRRLPAQLPLELNVDPEIIRRMGLPMFSPATVSPLTYPNNLHIPGREVPWAHHTQFAAPGPQDARRKSVPAQARVQQAVTRAVVKPGSGHIRQRTWSVTLSSAPDGELVPTGLIADDGLMIHHGPGQHIRPAPHSGPGSSSASGLVDYANIFVKNLDPDINSHYLEDLFSNVGRVISAKVMRDDQHRSRGYGFVSFFSPAEAAQAIAIMNNTKVGNQVIAVTLHEPRKLRPEKLADRLAKPVTPLLPTGRRSSSPTRIDRKLRHLTSAPAPVPETDGLRSLSPDKRKVALANRLTDHVQRFARSHFINAAYVEPAVRALTQHDLALIPLLYDPRELDLKIAETMAVLQDDPDLVISIDAPGEQTLASPAPKLAALTEEEIRFRLIIEVGKIDPPNAEAIVTILWRLLNASERIRALDSRGFLAVKYGVAKRELERQRKTIQPEQSIGLQMPEPSDATDSDREHECAADLHDTAPGIPLIPIKDVTLDGLAARSATDIMAHLSSSIGADILAKLEMRRPTSEEATDLARWILVTFDKPEVNRTAQVVAMLGEHLGISAKRSSRLRAANTLVNQEDMAALCKLLAYPKLLNAKARACQIKQKA